MDSKAKLEAKKKARLERERQWKDLMEHKPDDKYEDPNDVAAIRYAETHMGDYKLKTGETYVVPESERIDAEKKLRQMMLLMESVHNLKHDHNSTVLELRSKKQRIIDLIKQDNLYISELYRDLSQTEPPENIHPLWHVEMEASAFPEKKFETTPEEILRFKHAKEASAEKAKTDAQGGGGFGGFGGSAFTKKEIAAPVEQPGKQEKLGLDSPTAASERIDKNMSQLEISERRIKATTMTYRKTKILAVHVPRSLLADLIEED